MRTQFFTEPKDIEQWLYAHKIVDFSLRPHPDYGFVVDVPQGDIQLEYFKLQVIPVKFGLVADNFSCRFNELTNLDFFPLELQGAFDCSNNRLRSLKGCGPQIGYYFSCENNFITSLQHLPKMDGGLECSHNCLTSLEFCPELISGGLDCSFNQITSLKGVARQILGGFDCSNNYVGTLDYFPELVSGSIDVGYNRLISLKGSPAKAQHNFNCAGNKLPSLEHCPKEIGADFNFQDNPVATLRYFPQVIKGYVGGRDTPIVEITKTFNPETLKTESTLETMNSAPWFEAHQAELIRLEQQSLLAQAPLKNPEGIQAAEKNKSSYKI